MAEPDAIELLHYHAANYPRSLEQNPWPHGPEEPGWSLLARAVHRVHGQFSSAEPHNRGALTAIELAARPDANPSAIALNKQAALLPATNRLAEAEPLMRRAIRSAGQTFE